MHDEPPGPAAVPGRGGPVDARIGRVQQGATAIALLAGFVFHIDLLLPIWTLVLGLDAVAPPGHGPIGSLYHLVVGDRVGPPKLVHPASRLRANALPEAAVLVLGSAIMLLGAGVVGWILGLVVAAGAAYSAATDACVGCEMTRRGRRLR
ncbi:MAG: DUF4395 family protein [Actinobacteria bacterium]|nr:DUF4395 family protein [Actinomycetota bacterium]